MVTNETVVLNFPEDVIRTLESSFSVESFEGTIDPQNSWRLITPFVANSSGIVPGMIARMVRTGFSQGSVQTYVIDSATSTGFVLRLPGQPALVGRGPGVIFGIDPVKVKIVDLSPILEQARKTVDARHGTFRTDDADVQALKDEAVQRIAILRATAASDPANSPAGSAAGSVDQYEIRILERLGSDLLRHLTRVKDGALNWPRVLR